MRRSIGKSSPQRGPEEVRKNAAACSQEMPIKRKSLPLADNASFYRARFGTHFTVFDQDLLQLTHRQLHRVPSNAPSYLAR